VPVKKGDRVRTPDGPGVVTRMYVKFDALGGNIQWLIVEFPDGKRRAYRADQLEPVDR
jgi:hypothetical protein